MLGDVLLRASRRPLGLSLVEPDWFDDDGLWLGGVICLHPADMEQRATARGRWNMQARRLRAAARAWLLAPIGFPMQTYGRR